MFVIGINGWQIYFTINVSLSLSHIGCVKVTVIIFDSKYCLFRMTFNGILGLKSLKGLSEAYFLLQHSCARVSLICSQMAFVDRVRRIGPSQTSVGTDLNVFLPKLS